MTPPSTRIFSAQSDSCLECGQCRKNREPYCDQGQTGTYAGTYKRDGPGKGAKSYGGYANYHRAPGHFVVKIPDGLDHALAAPMLCGGVTVYSPLTQYGAGKEAKDVGIVGVRLSYSLCSVFCAADTQSLLAQTDRRSRSLWPACVCPPFLEV